MKKTLASALALLLLLFALSACGSDKAPAASSANSNSGSGSNSGAVPQPSPESVEESTITGMVTGVNATSISLKTDTFACLFTKTSQTVVEGKDAVAVGDTVTVYYTGRVEATPEASRIVIESRKPTVGTASGVISDLTDSTLTVDSAGETTYTFLYNGDTQITGDPTEGDQVEITYYGDLGGAPVALVIEVKKEQKQPEAQTMKGTVSDLAKTSVTLSIDTSHNYTFLLTNATQVTGAAKAITLGDKVNVTYTGELIGQPTATVVDIVKVADPPSPTTAVIDGVVTSLAANGFSVNISSNQTYFFSSDKSTQWSGVNLDVKCNVHITYTGELTKKPYAAAVVISAPTPAPAPTPTPTIYTCTGTVDYITSSGFGALVNGASYFFTTNAATVWGGTTALGQSCNVNISYTGSLTSAVAVRVDVYSPTPSPEPPTPDPMVTFYGTVSQVRLGGLSVISDDGELISLNTTGTDFPDGAPDVNDYVEVTYNTSTSQAAEIDVVDWIFGMA